MKKYVVILLCMVIVAACHKAMIANQDMLDQEIATLTDQLIYGEDEKMHIKALHALTERGAQVRNDAVSKLIKTAKNDPKLFPRNQSAKNPSLLQEIMKADYLLDNKAQNQKEYVKLRMMHLKMLNHMVEFCIEFKAYAEMTEILYQKYLYGTAWSKETLSIYNNKSAAAEFRQAGNASIAYLQLLLEIVRDAETKNVINKYLKEIGD